MLVQHHRQWTNVKPTLLQRIVSAGGHNVPVRVYYSSVMNNFSLFVSPVIFLFHQGYIICPII